MYLIAILGEKLKFTLSKEINLDGLQVGSVFYLNIVGGDWTGFYDFLRTNDGSIIGIRYSPLEDDPVFLGAVKDKLYARLFPNKTIEFYFSNNRSFVPELSCDQEFVGNLLLRSSAGEYAVTFGIDRSTPIENVQIRSLLAAPGLGTLDD